MLGRLIREQIRESRSKARSTPQGARAKTAEPIPALDLDMWGQQAQHRINWAMLEPYADG